MTLFTSYFEIGSVSGISIISLKFSFKQLLTFQIKSYVSLFLCSNPICTVSRADGDLNVKYANRKSKTLDMPWICGSIVWLRVELFLDNVMYRI